MAEDRTTGAEAPAQRNAEATAAEFQKLADEQLMERVVLGQVGAFDVLVARHKGRLYSYLLRLLRDPTEAEDVAQEAFVRAYVHADKYRNIAKFSTWLYTIATNLVRNRVRKFKSTPRLVSLSGQRDDEADEPIDLLDPGDRPDRTHEKKELHALVADGIEKIPTRYREAFVLREVNHLSYEEIAAITGLKLGTVRSRINRGRGHFRDAMEPVLRKLKR